MPTTLFAHQHHHPPFGPGAFDGSDLHHVHPSNALYIISEHEFVHSLIPPPACDDRIKTGPPRAPPPRRIQTTPARSPPRKAPRPLMATLSYAQDASLGQGAAPGSPPDLTNSKSSKSSSFHSSNLSDMMSPGDLTHFEEIALDDVQGAPAPASFPVPVSPSHRVLYEAPPPRDSAASLGRSLSQPHTAVHSFRDLTKPRYPSLKPQVNSAVRQHPSLNAPNRSIRRGFTSPSSPSLTNMGGLGGLSAPNRRSRSPSPTSHPQKFPSVQRSLSRGSSRNLEVTPSSGMSSRRQSWQHPVRKTAEEREAEVDDEDDEVPEDLAMPNVPISPRPVQERSPSTSPAVSRPVSQRSDSLSIKSVPSLSQKHFSPLPSPVATSKENLPLQGLTRQRTNTWEDTYKTLDEDSKALTEKLEEYQTGVEHHQGLKRQQSSHLTRSASVEEKPKSSSKPLPPLRKSDPLIDPFQPSAEKEKYMSRTRPSWLPPKNKKEEQKHLKEYAKIQARIEESKREQEKKDHEEALAREKAGQKKMDMWEKDLLPKFDTTVGTQQGKSTYRQLWWTGIPSKVRGRVWKAALGNELEISETTFIVALEKAQNEIKELKQDALGGKATAIIESTKDVFPDLKMFAPKTEAGEEQPLHADLVNICLAYAMYRPDVTEVTGFHHIAGLFLLNMSAVDTFICLGNLLNRPLPLSFLIHDYAAMIAAYDITLSTVSRKAPSLARHLASLRVEPRDYLRPMFSSLFCDRLPLEHAARIMDVYAIEGDKIAPRAAVGLIGILEGKLYQGGTEDVVRNLNTKDMKLHPDDFMARVFEAGKISSV